MENNTEIPKKLKTELPYDPAIPQISESRVLRYLYIHVQGSISYHSQNVEANQVSING